MLRAISLATVLMFGLAAPVSATSPLRGTYVEARTCQVYTGPCFANGEVGSAGKHAIMTWQIKQGTFAGVDLSDQSVSVVVKSSDTLGFKGLEDAKTMRAIVIVNASADEREANALQRFALYQTGLEDDQVESTERADIEMNFDMNYLTATVQVGDLARLETRKARKGDCICSNESAYYPPLTKLKGFVPGVTIEGDVTARRLGTRWSIPDSRSAYLGTFEVDTADLQLAAAF